MSNNIVPIKLARTNYPLTHINNQRTWAVLKGCGENSYQVFPSTSFDNSQITITCNPPSNRIVVDRLIFVRNTYLINFTGVDQGSNLIQLGSNDAPRAMPIAATTNTITVSVNNDQFTTNLNQYWSGLSRYHNTLNNRDEFLSMTPAFQDKSQLYSDLAPGSTRNPLGNYSDSADGQILRGGYADIDVVSNSHTAAQIRLRVTEPLYLSPFLFSGEDCLDSGFVGVNNMSLVLTNGDLNRVWSHSSLGNALLSISTTLVASEAQFHYLAPNITSPLPVEQSWPYFEVTSYPTSIGSLAAGASSVFSVNSVQIKAIPNKIYVFARRSDATQSYLTTDTFAGISNITVSYGTKVGLLSTASQQELYQMSLKNGLKMNYSEFIANIGSVVCIKPGEDIGLDALSASGMLDNQTLSMNVTVKNISSQTIAYTLYMVVVNSGTVSMVNGSFMHQVGVFNSQDVLNLDNENAPVVPYVKDISVYGGNWLDSVKNWLVNARDKVKPYLSPILDFIPDPRVQAARKVIGVGARRKMSKKRGGVLVGGKKMSKDMLRDRLMSN